jgi:hypothetical protein
LSWSTNHIKVLSFIGSLLCHNVPIRHQLDPPRRDGHLYIDFVQ